MKKSIYTVEQQTFCTLLREWRKSKGITQIELAEKLAKPQSFVAKVEIGERRLDVIEFLHICSVLEIEKNVFLKEYEKRLAGAGLCSSSVDSHLYADIFDSPKINRQIDCSRRMGR